MRKEKRTYRDRAEYLKKAVIKRRDKLRAMALEYKGGKCELCGYNRCGSALSFHHNDPQINRVKINDTITLHEMLSAAVMRSC